MRTLNTEQSKKRVEQHVCPLQIDVVERLIERYSQPGEIVLDPFAGVGTTLLCARAAGRYSVGIEKDEAQCAEIVRRLKPTFGEPVRRKQSAPDMDILPMFAA